MGGEEGPPSSVIFGTIGLPPRGRGRARGLAGILAGIGITPAWAGKSLPLRVSPLAARDYPRVGGEESIPRFALRATGGLPPRGRGREVLMWLGTTYPRITPAWAGKSRPNGFRMGKEGDYPRVGGEENPVTVTTRRG